MTVFVMPDPIGHPLLSAGEIAGQAGNDVMRSGPAMTVFVMPDPIGHPLLSAGEIAGQAGNDVMRSGPAMTWRSGRQ